MEVEPSSPANGVNEFLHPPICISSSQGYASPFTYTVPSSPIVCPNSVSRVTVPPLPSTNGANVPFTTQRMMKNQEAMKIAEQLSPKEAQNATIVTILCES